MNILIVSQYFWPESFRINELALELKGRGHCVTVLTGKPNYPEGRFFRGYGFWGQTKENYQGVTICRVPLLPRGKGNAIRLALNYISFALLGSLLSFGLRKNEYDLIFVFEVSPVTVGLPAIVLKKWTKAPIFFWVLDLWPESISSSGRVYSKTVLNAIRLFVRFIYRHCNTILVSSKGFIPSIRNLAGKNKDIRYFPNFIESSFATKQAVTPDSTLRFPEGFRIMFAGNIGVSQAFPTILEAARKLRAHKDIHWIILGEGRMSAFVRNEIKKAGMEANFHMLGRYPLRDMPFFFTHAHALLVSLKKEPHFSLTVPGKVQAYLSSGKPVIASLDGEGARLIEQAKAGVVCPAEDADALTKAIIQLYHLPKDVLAEMGTKAQVFCRRHFDRKTLMDRLESWMTEAVRMKRLKGERR